jgi:transcriptional regulator with XRE-family HTH domain
MDYSKAIRIARAIAGIEQRELAKRADLDPSYVSLIESGARRPSLRAIAKFSKALEVPEPLLTMLATESGDLKGIEEEEEFQTIGGYLARFLVRHGSSRKGRRKRPRSNAA